MEIQKIRNIVKDSYSINDLCKKVYGYCNGRVKDKISEIINDNLIDISHFGIGKKNIKYSIIEKVCPVCGDKFKTQKGSKSEKTTCSLSCANTHFRSNKSKSEKDKISKSLTKYYLNKKIEYLCKKCGKKYFTNKNHRSKNKCERCVSEYGYRYCVVCNKKFKRNRTLSGYLSKSKTCSNYCSRKLNSINKKNFYSDNNFKKCIVCNEKFKRKKTPKGNLSRSKTCSPKCRSKLRSKNAKNLINKRIAEGTHNGWVSRNKKSYPEKFFKKVLKNNGLLNKCEVEYKIKKKDLGSNCHSNYFLDFYFPDKKIDLEIDGKQHSYKKRKLSDQKRDFLLESNGIKVYRIKWKSINNDTGKKYIREEIDKFLKFYNSN